MSARRVAPSAGFTDAPAARPLQWRSRATLRTLAEALAPGWDEWCTRWGFSSATTRAENAWEAGDLQVPGWQPVERRLGVFVGAAVATVRMALFGADAAAATSADEVAGRALADLRARVGAHFGPAQAATGEPAPGPDASDLRPWSGAVRIALGAIDRDGQPFACTVHADADAARAAFGASTPTGRGSATPGPLASVADALADRVVALDARLEPLTLTLGSLQGLRVGDVLALPHRLDQPLVVLAAGAPADAPAFCNAWLGARGDFRALEFVAALPAAA